MVVASQTRYVTASREHATRGFCQRFKAIQSSVSAHLQGIANETERAAYVSSLFRRLMFLYFLQKKGLLDGDTDYLVHRLQLVQQFRGRESFYRSFLLPLFQAIFCEESPAPELAALLGDVPCRLINCAPTPGMPQMSAPENAAPNIQIADEAFAALFACFDAYEWRLDERTRADEQALYPSILAAIFEQRANQKQMGAYYTKEDVTAYIASNTIIPHFFDAARERYPAAFAPGAAMWQQLQADPERYIPAAIRQPEYLPTETEREYAARRTRHRQLHTLLASGTIDSIQALVTCNLAIEQFARDTLASCVDPALLLAFYTSIENMTILDPTCGPGAFLFAALNLLAPLYTACMDRMQALISTPSTQRTPYHSTIETCHAILKRGEQYANRKHYILHTIITNNLYGVDVMPGAVEVCRQRLLLALLAHIEHVETIEPLPALTANIRAGNALVGSLRDTQDDRGQDLPISKDKPYYRAAAHSETSPRSDQHPFHWPTEFPAIMARGGFDVIIGNPPYIEYSKIRQHYRVGGYETESCGNLYAAVVERSLALCRSRGGSIGLIVPLSLCGSERFASLRRAILDQTAVRWLANFEIFPGRLFDGAFQRLSILIARRDAARQHGSTYVTRIQRWYAAERPHLLDLISYTEARCSIRPDVFPKLASPLQATILRKVVERAGGACLTDSLVDERTAHFIYYQEATNYWMKAVCHVPFYKKNGVIMEPPHGRFLFFNDELSARTIMAVMNSSLFYIWFVTYADGFHLSHTLVKEFPAGRTLYSIKELPLLSLRLEEDIQRHARLTTRNTRSAAALKKAGHLIELEEYRMSYSRPIIDEIDRALAEYYGFTDDELDFIMHYEIKYRLGQEDR